MARIYTRTGDKGQTGLWGGARVAKNHPRVCAYGDVDELNCALGLALTALDRQAAPAVAAALERVQNELFVVGALLAGSKQTGLPAQAAARLEREIDELTAALPPLKQFVLPGGCEAGARLHVARAVCRRAERQAVSLSASEELPDNVVVYLNRLSDYLFTAARWVNARAGRAETPWDGLGGAR